MQNRRASDYRSDRRLAYIDGLRAVAVLLVVVFHARAHTPGVHLEHVFLEGTHGVDLFFVLSGFCLAAPTLQRLQREGIARFDVIAFAAKRVLRIFPPYAAAVLIFALAGWYAIGHGVALPPGMRPHFEWTDVAGELLFFDRTNQHINQSFWSLAIEFRWYFLFPLMLALWAARPRALLAIIFMAVVASELTRASSTDLGVLPAFLLGIVAAQIHINRHPIARIAPLIGLAGVGAALLLERGYHFPVQTNVGWHVVAFALVVAAGHERWLQRILGQRWLTAVGLASYSIYLVHEPIVSATVGVLAPRIGSTPAFFAAIGLGLLGGAFMWAVVERPITDRAVVSGFVAWTSGPLRRLFTFAGVPFELKLGHAPVPAVAAASPSAPTIIEFRPGRERAAES
jgi:peptidoglycan/LPS O-acetylase OafA/YrhL